MITVKHYIAENSPDAATTFIKDLVNKIKSLADNGIQGSPRDWVSFGLRVFIYKDRAIYFRINDDRMIVIRILNVRQDVSTQEF